MVAGSRNASYSVANALNIGDLPEDTHCEAGRSATLYQLEKFIATMATLTDLEKLYLGDPWRITMFVFLIAGVIWVCARLLPSQRPLHEIPTAGLEFGNKAKRQQAYIKEAKRIYTEGYCQVMKISCSRLDWQSVPCLLEPD